MDEILCSINSDWWFPCRKKAHWSTFWSLVMTQNTVHIYILMKSYFFRGKGVKSGILTTVLFIQCIGIHLFNELVSSIFNVLHSLPVNLQISFKRFMLLQQTLIKYKYWLTELKPFLFWGDQRLCFSWAWLMINRTKDLILTCSEFYVEEKEHLKDLRHSPNHMEQLSHLNCG